MRKALLLLSAFFFIWSTGQKTSAQEQPASRQPASSPAPETERPKNEVDRLLDEAKARGEIIMGTCIQDCGDAGAQNSDVEPGKILELPKPNYPPIARAAHAFGTVEVQVIIGTDGNVIAAVAISGHPLLRASAVSAARQTRFTPPKYKGEPVKVVGVLQYNFVAQ